MESSNNKNSDDDKTGEKSLEDGPYYPFRENPETVVKKIKEKYSRTQRSLKEKPPEITPE